MKLHCCAAVVVLLLLGCWAGPALARVRITADSIIVEAASLSERNDRSTKNENDDFPSLPYPFPFPISASASSSSSGSNFNSAAAFHQFPASGSSVVPSGTFLMGERSCWTVDGKIGTCGSIRSCYPNFKLPVLANLETWVLGIRGTCHYTESDGRQMYGICCTKSDEESTDAPSEVVNTESTSTTETPSAVTTEAPTSTTHKVNTTICGTDGIPVVEVDPETGKPVPNFPWWNCFPFKPLYPTTTTTSTTTESTTVTPTPTAPLLTSAAPLPTSATQSPTAAAPLPTTEATTTTSGAPTSTTTNPGLNNQGVEGKGGCGAGPYKTLSLDEQRRIVGGTDAQRNSWPFVVALLNNGRQFCGGSIISHQHILTAAHCIAHMSSWDVARLEIAFGMHVLKPTLDPAAVRMKCRRITRHKGFDSRTLYNDIAIVRIDLPIVYGPTMSPVCLPPPGSTDLHVGREAAVVGWGALKEGGGQPSVLQQVTVQIITNEVCKANYGSDAPGGIVDHMICAAYPGKDSCSGDSGGPLVIQDVPGAQWVQTGVVSWGIGCGQVPYPGVYTRVTHFHHWITVNTH